VESEQYGVEERFVGNLTTRRIVLEQFILKLITTLYAGESVHSWDGKSYLGSWQHLIAEDLDLTVTEKELKMLLHLVYLHGKTLSL
jgi:hypothetical protein